MANRLIKLIHSVGDVINSDAAVKGRLKVVFLNDYNVKLGQRVYPSADLSNGSAGWEGSVWDRKHEIRHERRTNDRNAGRRECRDSRRSGAENFFLFGLTAAEVQQRSSEGYSPRSYYDTNPVLKEVIDALISGEVHAELRPLFQPLLEF